MCYSLKTSILSYGVGMLSAIFAFSTRQWVIGCLILSYVQMQLSEIMIWYGLDNQKDNWNILGTSYGKYLLPTHNLAIGLGILLSLHYVSKSKIKIKDYLPIVAGILFFLYVVFVIYKKHPSASTTYPDKGIHSVNDQHPENRLRWPYPQEWYTLSYLLSLAILGIWVKPRSTQWFLLMMYSISFVVMRFIYKYTIGSIWCWSTSVLAPIIVLVNYVLIRNVSSSKILT